ncbi:MAG: hypothetical protein KAY05_03045 [Aeromonadaceae bacterium]|nr:hypothetical protein [Aeromonadaceae bacterium]MBP8772548.1 hypothetical protein [Aeromonadaceae bacterium]
MMTMTKMTLLAAMIAGIVGCSTQPDEALDTKVNTEVTQVKGTPGGIVTQTQVLTASVVEIDRDKREFVLQDEAGHRRHVIAPPEMVNFPQLAVGDTVKATLLVETVAYLHDADTAKTDSETFLAAAADEGEKPGMLVAGRTQVTARVTAIDIMARTASLQFEDGSTRVVPARDDVVLTHDLIGKQVVIIMTTAVAAEVIKL